MRNKNVKKLVVAATVFAMGVTSILPSSQVQAAKVKKLTVKTKKVTLYKGAAAGYGSTQLKVTVKPKKAKVSYKVSNKKVATVTKKGLVKAKKVGKTNVIVKAGSKKVTVKVVVKKIKKKVTKVTATKSITVAVGEKQKIKTSVKPAKATLKALTFTSKNKKVATVSAKGAVKGVKEGSVKVVVKAVDGSKKKATVSVVVSGGAVSTTTTAPAVSAPATTPAVSTNAPAAGTTETPAATETAAPTGTPAATETVAPTGTPAATETAAPTETPVVTNTAAPTGTPVAEVEVKDNGDGTKTVSANLKNTTLSVVSTSSALNGVVINGDLVSYLAKTITGSKTATGSAASFKASTASTYGSIAINKKEGEDTAKVQVSETKSYNVSLVSAKDETTKEETGEIALVVANPDTNTNSLSLNATATDEGKYTVTDLTVGDTTASGTYAADVTEDANGTQTIELTSATNANNKFKITYSEESGDFTYTAPQEYLDKYGLEASK